jgi:hypothetical protein
MPDTTNQRLEDLTDGRLAAELTRRGYELHYRHRYHSWQAVRRDATGAPIDVLTGHAIDLRDALLQALRRTGTGT